MEARHLFLSREQVTTTHPGNNVKQKQDSLNHEKALSGVRILIVDDSPINQIVAEKTLQKYGAITGVASNGKSGLKAYIDDSFDLVLMDIEMPVVNGFEATALIKKTKKYQAKRIPILAYTTCPYLEIKTRMEAIEMDGYVSKPFKPNTVMKDIVCRVNREYANYTGNTFGT